jgi:hypothetical protein
VGAEFSAIWLVSPRLGLLLFGFAGVTKTKIMMASRIAKILGMFITVKAPNGEFRKNWSGMLLQVKRTTIKNTCQGFLRFQKGE